MAQNQILNKDLTRLRKEVYVFVEDEWTIMNSQCHRDEIL